MNRMMWGMIIGIVIGMFVCNSPSGGYPVNTAGIGDGIAIMIFGIAGMIIGSIIDCFKKRQTTNDKQYGGRNNSCSSKQCVLICFGTGFVTFNCIAWNHHSTGPVDLAPVVFFMIAVMVSFVALIVISVYEMCKNKTNESPKELCRETSNSPSADDNNAKIN